MQGSKMFTVSQFPMLQIELLPSLRMPEVRTKAANQVEFSTNTTPVRKSTMFWMKFR